MKADGLGTDILWLSIGDPGGYVKIRLAEEADDIPDHLIAAGSWYPDTIDIREIRVDRPLIARHDREPRHIARRDAFIAAIWHGKGIPPLIVLGSDRFLVDGYARYRALVALGIPEVMVVRQRLKPSGA
jgi:hypothetical protein